MNFVIERMIEYTKDDTQSLPQCLANVNYRGISLRIYKQGALLSCGIRIGRATCAQELLLNHPIPIQTILESIRNQLDVVLA